MWTIDMQNDALCDLEGGQLDEGLDNVAADQRFRHPHRLR